MLLYDDIIEESGDGIFNLKQYIWGDLHTMWTFKQQCFYYVEYMIAVFIYICNLIFIWC